MAIKAVHLPLAYRVVGNEGELRLDVRMTTVTEFGHLFAAYLLLRPFVHFMTGRTTQFVQGVYAAVPV